MFCHVVESAYLCTRKRETTRFATMFFELLLTRQEKRKCSTRKFEPSIYYIVIDSVFRTWAASDDFRIISAYLPLWHIYIILQ